MDLSLKDISSLNVTHEPSQNLISDINKIFVEGDVLLPEQQSHFHTKLSKINTQRSKFEHETDNFRFSSSKSSELPSSCLIL